MTKEKRFNLMLLAANLVSSMLVLTAGYFLIHRFMLWVYAVIVCSWLINALIIVRSAEQNSQKNGIEDHV
jgi:hypothetical protein